MKRYVLVVATLTTLLVTGVTLHAAGWFSPHVAHPRTAHGSHQTVESATSSIPAYYRQGGPRHWRDCMGQY